MKGIPVSSGLGMGKPVIIEPFIFHPTRCVVPDEQDEVRRFETILDATKAKMTQRLSSLDPVQDKDAWGIQQAHISMLEDPELIDSVKDLILEEKVCSEYALHTVSGFLVEELRRVDDEVIMARAADVEDITHEMLRLLTDQPSHDLSPLLEDVIIVARDLAPSFIISQDRTRIKGVICEEGSATSHIAILCRGLGIPAVFGVKDAISQLKHASVIAINGSKGIVEHSITTEQREQLQKKIDDALSVSKTLLVYKGKVGKTKDHKTYLVAANIGSIEEGQMAKDVADGIGLFRTEFMFMEHAQLPDEEYQYNVYSQVLKCFNNKPVTIRTCDAGGDKNIPAMSIKTEENPFLGVRGIRLSLKYEDIFMVQLRALLRAGTEGNLRILIPMITRLEEARIVKALLTEAESQLDHEGMSYARNVKLGMMIEVPSAAVCSDLFAQEVDFFSIGTNDLTQYVLAADRNNQGVLDICSSFNPAVLRLMEQTVKSAHQAQIPVCVCGELGSDPLALPLLVGMGVDEISVSTPSVLILKKLLDCITVNESHELLHEVLCLSTANEITAHIEGFYRLKGMETLLH